MWYAIFVIYIIIGGVLIDAYDRSNGKKDLLLLYIQEDINMIGITILMLFILILITTILVVLITIITPVYLYLTIKAIYDKNR